MFQTDELVMPASMASLLSFLLHVSSLCAFPHRRLLLFSPKSRSKLSWCHILSIPEFVWAFTRSFVTLPPFLQLPIFPQQYFCPLNLFSLNLPFLQPAPTPHPQSQSSFNWLFCCPKSVGFRLRFPSYMDPPPPPQFYLSLKHQMDSVNWLTPIKPSLLHLIGCLVWLLSKCHVSQE